MADRSDFQLSNVPDRSIWVSWARAAELLGCSENSLHQMIKRGDLRVDRPGNRQLPSLLLEDVERLAERRAAARFQKQRKARQRARREARRRARLADPPGEEWVSTNRAAAILGRSPAGVRLLASQDRLPHIVRADGAYRFQRRQIEVIANAWRAAPSSRLGSRVP